MPIVGVFPVVISTNPANDATGAPLNHVITVTFNEVMNSLTITQESFTLQQAVTLETGTVSYAGTTVSFTLASALSPNTTYTGTVAPTVKDYMGRVLASDTVWSFTTCGTTSSLGVVDLGAKGYLGVAGN